jgi:hypothetical protein
MKPRDYCCCAIPIINAGVYATLAEQFVLGLLVGVLSVGTPSSQYPLVWWFLEKFLSFDFKSSVLQLHPSPSGSWA